jgi:hypothetical protein
MKVQEEPEVCISMAFIRVKDQTPKIKILLSSPKGEYQWKQHGKG